MASLIRQRRPRAIEATSVARVSDRIGRTCPGGVLVGRRISRFRVEGIFCHRTLRISAARWRPSFVVFWADSVRCTTSSFVRNSSSWSEVRSKAETHSAPTTRSPRARRARGGISHFLASQIEASSNLWIGRVRATLDPWPGPMRDGSRPSPSGHGYGKKSRSFCQLILGNNQSLSSSFPTSVSNPGGNSLGTS